MKFRNYQNTSQITGAFTENETVKYQKTLAQKEQKTLLIHGAISIVVNVLFLTLIALTFQRWIPVILIFTVEFIRILQHLVLWICTYNAVDPLPMHPNYHLRIAILTTIVPQREPLDMVTKTLKEMKQVTYADGKVDVFLLDEGNSPEIKEICGTLGVIHFSRKNIEKWNQPSGEFREKTKHGNHNDWRAQYENQYDIVAQMDPDHVPKKDFLVRSLGYFKDPRVAFVVSPQVYGNLQKKSIVAGAAFQSFIFHAVIQRCGNILGAPLLIGTNHLYRTTAFKEIGGYQDSIIEDHLTSMKIFSDNKNWTGVYTPDILAVGEGPSNYTDYFNQQKRWAYGVWQIILEHSRKDFKKMKRKQALSFTMLQFFYPSVALSWIFGFLASFYFIFTTNHLTYYPLWLNIVMWLASISSTLGFFVWIRRFNLTLFEQKDLKTFISGFWLFLVCVPTYVLAGLSALVKKPLQYTVTAKGSLESCDTFKTFHSQFFWMIVSLILLGYSSAYFNLDHVVTLIWIFFYLLICFYPLLHHALRLFQLKQIQKIDT